jgi:hypothetical protein
MPLPPLIHLLGYFFDELLFLPGPFGNNPAIVPLPVGGVVVFLHPVFYPEAPQGPFNIIHHGRLCCQAARNPSAGTA